MSVNLCGTVTRSLYQVWSGRAGSSNKLSGNGLPFALHDVDIYPSCSQVHEMLQSASQCSRRPAADYITFGEFCIFATELQASYDSKVTRTTPLSLRSKKDLLSHQSKCSRLMRMNSASTNTKKPINFQVFLGGSCNPTTWRQKIAIPFFKGHGIMPYNPQVAVWGQELIQLENQAKENAEVLFFVIDNQTRSIASMIEAGHLSGSKKKLILVMGEMPKPGMQIFGETITDKEYHELRRGYRYVQDLTENQNIPVFPEIEEALKSTVRILKENISPQDLTLMDTSRPIRMAHVPLGNKLAEMRDIFNSLDVLNSGYINLDDVRLAHRLLLAQELSACQLKAIIEGQNGKIDYPVNLDSVAVSFDQFCCIMAEFVTPSRLHVVNNNNTHNAVGKLLVSLAAKLFSALRTVIYPFSQLVDWFLKCPRDASSLHKDGQFIYEYKDIFLGGSGQPSTWRKDVAIPYLKTQGLTFCSPLESPWNDRLMPLEAARIDSCAVLLFVITSDVRALSQMILAGHYIGRGCNVVLCIQLFEVDAVIDGEKLSEQAVKDYNRGRMYLSDMANCAGVPIFDDIPQALECAAKKCRLEL